MVRDIIKLRYSLLPVWYTAFRETSVTGAPVVRPQFYMFPKDEAGFAIDDQYYIGSSGLLVRPVTTKDATDATVYLGEKQVYYDYFSRKVWQGAKKYITVQAYLNQIPLFIRGGSIIPTRERSRRSSTLMKQDPFTLKVALDNDGNARGELYLDDGESYAHERGELIWREFLAVSEKGKGKRKTLRIAGRDLVSRHPDAAVDGQSLATYKTGNDFAKAISGVKVEKIVVMGVKDKPTEVKTEGGRALVWDYTAATPINGEKGDVASQLVIKNPGVAVTMDWSIIIE